MAESLISSALNAIVGVNKIFSATDEATGTKIWTALKIKDIEIDSETANTINPVAQQSSSENATLTSLIASDIQTIKIIQPSRVRLTCFADSISAIDNVTNKFSATKDTITISTKGITATGLTVVSVDGSQTPDMISATKLVIELEQVSLPQLPTSFNPSQSANASAISSYGVSVQSAQSTFSVSDIYNKISNFIKG